MICRLWRGWTTPGNVPPEAQAVLADFGDRSAHYEVLDRRDQPR